MSAGKKALGWGLLAGGITGLALYWYVRRDAQATAVRQEKVDGQMKGLTDFADDSVFEMVRPDGVTEKAHAEIVATVEQNRQKPGQMQKILAERQEYLARITGRAPASPTFETVGHTGVSTTALKGYHAAALEDARLRLLRAGEFVPDGNLARPIKH